MYGQNEVLLVIALVVCLNCCHTWNLLPAVDTPCGRIEGLRMLVQNTDTTFTEIHSFLGIPYATAPIGKLRFKKAKPITSWFGVFAATKKSPQCVQDVEAFPKVQWVSRQEEISEDCLYLNIWAPKTPTLKPVLVWIHGGGFNTGSSTNDIYDGTTLAAFGDVIVVSMNYRIGVLGFFSAGTEDAPGNMGLHDQYLALLWVKNNIFAFGGDPDKITIFGESAGAVSVSLHLVSPWSRGLFNRAILQSGSFYHPLADANPTLNIVRGEMFARSLGCADENTSLINEPKNVVHCLRKLSIQKLIKEESKLIKEMAISFIPTNGDDFLPINPLEALNNEDLNTVNLLIGNNRDEGSILTALLIPQFFNDSQIKNLTADKANFYIKSLFQSFPQSVSDLISDQYIKSTSDYRALRQRISEAYGDYIVVCPSILFSRKWAEKTNKVYYYLFSHRPSNTIWQEWTGVPHFDEVQFVFGLPLRYPRNYTLVELWFSKKIMAIWTSFARHGTISNAVPEWSTYSSENPVYHDLAPFESKISKGLKEEECNMWDQIFQTVS
ncbi:acetylcholinesterase-1-like [Limulus polyphemus]|uniref:Carboxylic ester hydrolase n=1 Tax=Limulus polyphemus TaxID=6850 RepID=A0ABM1BDN6_LIMPO|nr:acetylcholinesterase-1-like [Limulus polyphemus]